MPLRFRTWILSFDVLMFRIFGFEVQSMGCRVRVLGVWLQNAPTFVSTCFAFQDSAWVLGFRTWGSGFGVHGFGAFGARHPNLSTPSPDPQNPGPKTATRTSKCRWGRSTPRTPHAQPPTTKPTPIHHCTMHPAPCNLHSAPASSRMRSKGGCGVHLVL